MLIKKTKVKDMNKKPNSVSSAGTKDDSSTTAQDTSVRQHRSKPLVSRRLSAVDKAWSQGFAAACAITLLNHECDTIVEDTFRCNFMDLAAMRRRGVDEFDVEALKPIVKEIERKQSLNGG